MFRHRWVCCLLMCVCGRLGGWGRRGNNCRNPARGGRNLNENDRRSEEKEMGSRNFRDRMSLVLPKQFTLDQ